MRVLRAIRDEVEYDLLRLVPVGSDDEMGIARLVRVFDSPRADLRADHRFRIVKQLVDVHVFDVHRDGARLELREHENLFDEAEKILLALSYSLEINALFLS